MTEQRKKILLLAGMALLCVSLTLNVCFACGMIGRGGMHKGQMMQQGPGMMQDFGKGGQRSDMQTPPNVQNGNQNGSQNAPAPGNDGSANNNTQQDGGNTEDKTAENKTTGAAA